VCVCVCVYVCVCAKHRRLPYITEELHSLIASGMFHDSMSCTDNRKSFCRQVVEVQSNKRFSDDVWLFH